MRAPDPIPKTARRLPVGAEPRPAGTHFRVWAPRRRRVEVAIDGSGALHALEDEGNGYFSGLVKGLASGTRYRYRLDGGNSFPDPASRFQPHGPHGPSEVVDPDAFAWSDGAWRGVSLPGQVIYELHVGTFTREGTWEAASRALGHLADIGVTVIEMMPVSEFAGRFGWGYDGVDLFAPTHLYGAPDDLRRFVDRAHGHGLGVILDVVYNHLGPDGNYLTEFAPEYFSDRYENEWGEPLNFDGPASGPVREFFIANAGYWIDEFHMDGLRLDATQQIFDASRVNVMQEMTRRVREAAGARRTLIVAENEPQDVKLLRPLEQGGYGMDALWNDDLHHSARVALTGRNEAYYSDYLGSPQELVSAVKHGFLYQGQRYAWQGKRRGTPALGLPRHAFVTYIENHDQIANSAHGLRMHRLCSPGRHRALTALFLLAPGTPMLFQGQEFGASAPFLFFADHKPGLAEAVRKGRAQFLSQFPSIVESGAALTDPGDPATFERCKLDHDERERNAAMLALHRDLLRLRRDEPALHEAPHGGVDGAVLGPEAFVLRFLDEAGDRLLLVNLGRDLPLVPAPEPLLAPPAGARWQTAWSSEDPRYGGGGTPVIESEDGGWRLPGHCAVLLRPAPLEGA
ncbi:MAG TPA: malto-oligosyltrehalose trehalohydrolase [Usitatibacter sp.]|nr:malto-oligosyltrehalose trehalohydrolase [Usitatibacter sp.]